MSLTAGTRLGPYEIVAPLGAGGMGAVYRARDTRLNRDIAIKVLLPAVAGDPDRLARFRREAQVLGALNHPNIAAIYGLEDSGDGAALVLELVEGPTLADRIALGPMATAEALPIARQLVDALDAAHQQGIVHRDLKPANIKVKPDGAVKVLDFGLAKALDPPPAGADAMISPTISVHATEPGIILGTAAYMAPEQARGKAVDKRADIWAFGCVLFEMLTGRRAFPGETATDAMAAVLEREPEWTRLPDSTPAALGRVTRRCLAKDPSRRLRDIGDARLEIEEAMRGSPGDAPVVAVASRRVERLAWISIAALLALAAGVAVMWPRRPSAPAPEMRLEIGTPPTRDPIVAISPDGRNVVFIATSDGRSRLWLRRLEEVSAQPLAGTEEARLPFWSPDSRSIGFFADGNLKRLDLESESTTVLAAAPFGQGGSWNRDGVILFAAAPASPLARITPSGGEAAAVTTVHSPRQIGHRLPLFLPDGRHFLFYVEGEPDVRGIHVGQLNSTESRRIVEADSAAAFAPGFLLFVRQSTLYAQSFDPGQLEVRNGPVPIASPMAVEYLSAAIAGSDTGSIVYRTSSVLGAPRFAWFDQAGKMPDVIGGVVPGTGAGPALAPDGGSAAFFNSAGGNTDIFVRDSARGAIRRITSNLADDLFPIWSPDGTRLVFSSTRAGGLDLYLTSTVGGGNEDLLLATPQVKAPSDWSPDGHSILFSSPGPETDFDIWVLPLDGNRTPIPIVRTRFNERLAQFSPDGRWIAYESNESGRYEIYMKRFVRSENSTEGKVPVSANGGGQVRWRRDGKALFYLGLDNRLMMVPVQFAGDGRTAEPGTPVPLFLTRIPAGALQPFPRHQYTVSRDGRFLMIVDQNDDTPTTPITVLLNWAAPAR